tara:strand:+ start:96 stop:473 length:378 start_codon:yes stop_codon:yes gene_type:complete
MSKLEVFQNGVFSNTGKPVFQIGTKKDDGTYEGVVFSLMSKAEAEAKLNELQPSAPRKEEAPKKEVPKKAAPKKAAKLKIPFKVELELMTKAELEKEMRRHGLELDRRKAKDALVKQSVAFLKGK